MQLGYQLRSWVGRENNVPPQNARALGELSMRRPVWDW
jgi:hypothetical protein